MDGKEIKKRLEEIFNKTKETYLKRWSVEAAAKGMDKDQFETELAFQNTKEVFQLPKLNDEGKFLTRWWNPAIVKSDKYKGFTIHTLKDAAYCEVFGCHKKTNMLLKLDSEKCNRVLCQEHALSFRIYHVTLGKPTVEQMQEKALQQEWERVKAKLWADDKKQ